MLTAAPDRLQSVPDQEPDDDEERENLPQQEEQQQQSVVAEEEQQLGLFGDETNMPGDDEKYRLNPTASFIRSTSLMKAIGIVLKRVYVGQKRLTKDGKWVSSNTIDVKKQGSATILSNSKCKLMDHLRTCKPRGKPLIQSNLQQRSRFLRILKGGK